MNDQLKGAAQAMLKLERTLRKLLSKIEIMKDVTQSKNEIVIDDDSVEEIVEQPYSEVVKNVLMNYYTRIQNYMEKRGCSQNEATTAFEHLSNGKDFYWALQRSIRNKLGNLSHQCKECNILFNDDEQLYQHVKKEHLTFNIYRCIVCQIEFEKKEDLATHINTHTGNKKIKIKMKNSMKLQNIQ